MNLYEVVIMAIAVNAALATLFSVVYFVIVNFMV